VAPLAFNSTSSSAAATKDDRAHCAVICQHISTVVAQTR
jgi:hypothetical protein